jgi:hypothetical protein
MNLQRESRRLAPLAAVYSVAVLGPAGRPRVLAASEGRDGACLLIDPATAVAEPVWTGPGGTMSLVPLPGESDHFFAVQRFFAGFDAAESGIVEVRAGNGPWAVTPRVPVPYLHRLGGFQEKGGWTLLACSLCAHKEGREDWSHPGSVYRIATAGPQAWQKVEVLGGLHRHHGFAMTRLGGAPVLLVSSMEGLFQIALPGGSDGAAADDPVRGTGRGAAATPWSHRRLLEHDVSDAVVLDWDGDGEEELVTVEPFHGDRFVFYNRDRDGILQAVHEMPCSLGHSLWAGRAFGQPALILGERTGAGRILLVFPTAGPAQGWATLTVAEDTGGTNVAVIGADATELSFVSANNDRNEVVGYRVFR